MNLDDPEERRAFRKSLSQLGLPEVRYRVGAGKYSKEKATVVKQWIADSESGAIIEDELLDACEELDALKERFVDGGNLTGLFLQTDDQAIFERLFLEAKTLVDEGLGDSNEYSRKLMAVYGEDAGRGMGGPSYACVTEIVEIVCGARKQMQRRPSSSPVSAKTAPRNDPYVDPSRLDEIRRVSSQNWDFRRLIQMCLELNIAYESRSYISVAMLVRGIIDHVPPVFKKANFREVANCHGGQSFKDSMKHLDKSMRKIGDAYLHEQIRQKESVPSAVQVDVRRELDLLLAEVIRLS